MIGMLVLVAAVAYVAAWWFLVTKLKRGWAKAAAILFALAIPFWDLPIGYLNYEAHCASDGGVKKLADIPPYKSIYLATFTGHRPESVLRAGLELVEESRYGGVTQFRQVSNGSIEKIEAQQAESDLRIRRVYHDPLPWNLSRQEMTLEVNSNNRVLLQARAYTWQGGWLRTQLPLGPVANCHLSSLGTLVTQALEARKR